MNRRKFLENGIGVAAGLVFFNPVIADKRLFDDNLNLEYSLLNEFQKRILMPETIPSKEYTAQKIEIYSENMLPFILGRKSDEYLFRKIKTPEGKFATEILKYDPLNSCIDERDISDKTIISEDSISPPSKKELKNGFSYEITKGYKKTYVKNIFDKDYLFVFVPYCYENEEFKTNFYLIPMKDLKIETTPIFKNPLIKTSDGIYRGFSLQSADHNIKEKKYVLEPY